MIEELKQKIKGEVLNDKDTLKTFSRDASLFEIQPEAVVVPRDSQDLQALVKFVQDNKKTYPGLAITPRAGGTDMSGAAVGDSIVVDFTKHMNRVIEVGQGYAISQPGVYYRDFEKETLKTEQLMPSFPASREMCAIGGMVANNSGGEKTLAFGQVTDFVQELKVVFSDGNEYTVKPLSAAELEAKMAEQTFEGQLYKKVYGLIEANKEKIAAAKPHVSKNSSGYYLWNVWDGRTFDLTKLLVGSQGTLCLITEVKFRLIRPKKHSKLVVIFLKDLKSLGKIVKEVLKHHPETFESYDDHTLNLAMRFLPEFVKKMGTNLIKLGFRFLPEVGMLLRGGLPKLVLTAEIAADTEEEVLRKAREVQESLKQFNVLTRVTKDDYEAQKYRLIRRESFNLLRSKIKNKQTAPFIEDIIVNPEKLPEFLPKLEAILNLYPKLIYTIAGHVGDGNFHIIPLMDLSEPEAPKVIAELSNKVYDLVFEYKGSMSAEHNDGMVRGPYLIKMFGADMYKLFTDVKHIFDPWNIFNPGKKVDTDQKYAIEHLKHG